MESKNKIEPKPKTKNKPKKWQRSDELFQAMLTFCKAPWIPSSQQLPEFGRPVYICYYTGERKGLRNKAPLGDEIMDGYAIATATRVKLNKKGTKEDIYDRDTYYASDFRNDMMWRGDQGIRINGGDLISGCGTPYMNIYGGNGWARDNYYRDYGYDDRWHREGRIKDALARREDIWLIFRAGESPCVFHNPMSPSTQSGEDSDLVEKAYKKGNFVNVTSMATHLNDSDGTFVPEFWMYVPLIK